MENIIQKLKQIEDLLLDLSYEGKDYLDVKETAHYLNLSTSAIYKMSSSKKINHYNPGGKKIYFRKSELNSWIEMAKISSIRDFDERVGNYLRRNQNS